MDNSEDPLDQFITDPSPEEIRRHTALIRAGWSDNERIKRADPRDRPVRFQLPVVNIQSNTEHEGDR